VCLALDRQREVTALLAPNPKLLAGNNKTGMRRFGSNLIAGF
jgi:hypothetical protein